MVGRYDCGGGGVFMIYWCRVVARVLCCDVLRVW